MMSQSITGITSRLMVKLYKQGDNSDKVALKTVNGKKYAFRR